MHATDLRVSEPLQPHDHPQRRESVHDPRDRSQESRLEQSQLLYLQRAAGNSAVASILSNERDQEATGLQRAKTDNADKPSAVAPAKSGGGESKYERRVNDVLELVSGGYTFLAQKQHDAIDSLQTEARKPHKPSLEEQLLTALAEGALDAALGGIGGLVAKSLEKKIAASFEKYAVDAAERALAKEAAKKLADMATDKMKETVKSQTKAKVDKVLGEGKAPVEAFFEGQKNAVIDAGYDGFKESVQTRGTVRDQPEPVGLASAEALFDAQTEVYQEAEARQKDETLKAWFTYEAQVERGTAKGEKGKDLGTDLSAKSDPIFFDTYGVLYLKFWTPTQKIEEAWLKGTSRNMISLIENKPIKDLGIPVVIRGRYSGMNQINEFTVRINEKGTVFVPESGGLGRQYLIMLGGGQLGMDQYGTTYSGGDTEMWAGARKLAEEVIGNMTLKGLLEPDKE